MKTFHDQFSKFQIQTVIILDKRRWLEEVRELFPQFLSSYASGDKPGRPGADENLNIPVIVIKMRIIIIAINTWISVYMTDMFVASKTRVSLIYSSNPSALR